MIYFTNASGGIALCVPERVYQGSPEGSKLYLVGPYAENAAVTAKFTLPDGSVSAPCLLNWESGVEGYADAEGNALSGWSAMLPACVTEKFGIVRVQFEIAAGGTVSTAAAYFTVERGTPPALPPQPQADIYAQILAALTGVRGDLANGYFAARSLYKWNALYEYGAGELVYFAEQGESGAFVRSVAAGNKGNPPYSGGVFDAVHWEEAVPFDAVLEAEENAAASASGAAASAAAAQSAAEAASGSEQAAASSKTAAAQSASSAETARQNAQTYAQNANTSADEAAASAELARQYAEIGIQPNTDYTALEDLPVPGTTKFIYLIPAQGDGESDAYNEYIWVPDKQGYEFIGSTKVDLTGYAQINGTYAGMTVGNADQAENALKAAQDGDGNQISLTYAKRQTVSGGFEAGGGSSAIGTAGVAVGSEASASGNHSVAIGAGAEAINTGSVAVGNTASASSLYSTAIGYGASASYPTSAAVGYNAKSVVTGAVQLGMGTNSAADTLQFKSYPLLDAAGNIPAGRLLNLYPVGAYYITESETTPASLFGGEWVRVNSFLYGAAVQSAVGDTGGEASHTLSLNEIPAHGHKLNEWTLIISAGASTGLYNIPAGENAFVNIFKDDAEQNRYSVNAGGGQAHNNLPPYRVVNIWRRTA